MGIRVMFLYDKKSMVDKFDKTMMRLKLPVLEVLSSLGLSTWEGPGVGEGRPESCSQDLIMITGRLLLKHYVGVGQAISLHNRL